MFVRTLSSFFIVVFVLRVTLAKSTAPRYCRARIARQAGNSACTAAGDKLWENVLGAQETARAADKQLAPDSAETAQLNLINASLNTVEDAMFKIYAVQNDNEKVPAVSGEEIGYGLLKAIDAIICIHSTVVEVDSVDPLIK